MAATFATFVVLLAAVAYPHVVVPVIAAATTTSLVARERR